MNYQDLSRDKLIIELQRLQQKYDSLKTSYEKDILERKQAGKALRLEKENFRHSLDDSSLGVRIVTLDGDTIYANKATLDLYGYDSLRELQETTLKNRYTSESYSQSLERKHQREHGDLITNNYEISIVRKDGKIRHLQVFRKEVLWDGVKQFQVIYNDITDRKMAEVALLKSEELFRIVISNAPISIFATNEKGIFILHEGKALEKTGMKSGENVGISAYDLFSELNVVEYNGEIINGESVLNRVLSGESLSGFTEFNGVYFDNQFVPLRDLNKQVIGLIGVATDVTTNKNAEKARKESEAIFRSLFENSLIGISAASPEGKLLQANPAYVRMYGYESSEKMLAEVDNVEKLFVNPADRKEVLRILNKNGFMEAKEIEVIRRDGSRFFVLVSAREIRDLDGNLLYNQATHIDLTERRKYEKKIREASFYARNLIEASIDPLVTISIDGKITDVNLTTEQITGIKREKLIGSDFADYFTEPGKARKGYKIVFSKGVVKDYPLTIINTSGQTTDVLFNATLFKNEAGDIQGVFAAARDISERKKMEEELRGSKELLEKLNQRLNEIRENERAIISREIHDELGQSLTALKLDLNWMYRYIGTKPEAKAKLEGMIEMISNTIKDVQRISSDLRPGILDDLGLAAAIEWYSEEFEKRTGIECRTSLDDSIQGDSQKDLVFFRVLQEALTNVIRHSEASSVSIKLYKSESGITMSIHDNGKGMLPEIAESVKSLGLIGMRERVRQFGGKIDISSKKGQGTMLTILIPSK
jgi:PAS domain S-box-containing protein